MGKKDVEQRKQELEAELTRYRGDRASLISEVGKKVAALGPEDAASPEDRLANARLTTVAEGIFLEGTNRADDKAPINFLELGLRASRAVCHLVEANRASLGTGFLVGPGLLLTNNHVLPDAASTEGVIAEFGFERDADENPLRPRRFQLEPSRLFVTSPQGKLDFSFVRIASIGLNGEALQAQGWLPLDNRPNKIFEGQPVVVIQHPNGQMKTICLFDSLLVLRDPDPDLPYMLYTTDTDNGSSGSPAFNRFWQVVGLHHASITTDDTYQGKPVILNRGIRISSIFKALNGGLPEGTVLGTKADIDAVLKTLMDPATRHNGRPFASAAPTIVGAVSSGGAVIIKTEGTTKTRGTVIRRRDPEHFFGRGGYNPLFLASGAKSRTKVKSSDKHSLRVPLPKLPDWLDDDAARLIDSEDCELKYQHFSIVMSKSRGLAIFTACNVDGSRMYRLDRKDRDPDDMLEPEVEPEAAADIWFYDPRLSESHQLGPELYDETSFDYGHLVRRLDPVWGGDDRTPRIANDDTFCMTNCSPQEVRFHRTRRNHDGNWSALEDVILNEANLKDKRFTIFTGPVFDPRDTAILGVKIPTAFWKIAVYEEAGKLKAHGFMLWQEEEVAELDEKFEGMIDLTRAKRPVRIREIARLTGLDFGPLFDADVRR